MVAILNPDILPDVRMTIEEYLSADLPEGHRYELVGGVVMMSPIPDPAHDLVVAALNAHFVLYCARRPGIVEHISQRCGVTIPTCRTVREPDLGVYSPDASPGRSGRTWRNATPMLVVEVISPGQEDRDYADKRRDYWDAGVSEYWIADPVRKTLTVLTRNRMDWAETVFAIGDTYQPAQLPGLDIPLAGLFEN